MDSKLLTKKRSVIKASITRIDTFLKDFNSDSDELAILKIKLRNLRDLAIKYDEVQSQLEIVEDFESNVLDDRMCVENLVDNLELKINLLLELENTKTCSNNNESINITTQLPPIKLPLFNGNILDWQYFYSTFNDLVHSRLDLSPIQKLHYLNSALQGEALELIKSLPIANENYNVAIELLKERYNNKYIIAVHHVNKFLQINSIAKESLEDISTFINKISATVNALQAMNLGVNIFELIIVQSLTSKLDSNTATLWKQKLSNDCLPNFTDFIHFLEDRRKLLQNITINAELTNPNHSKVIKNNKHIKSIDSKVHSHHNKRNYQTYHADVKTNVKIVQCIICKANHPLHMCNEFKALDVQKRKSLLIKYKCCFNCLRQGHSVEKCYNKTSCKSCTKRHHTLIHSNGSEQIKHTDNSSYCALKTKANRNILLSTAICNTRDTAGNFHTCRILLDSGSQANFCTFNFANRLGLNLTRHNLPISGINNSSCQSTHSVSVKLFSRYENFNFEVQCAVLPDITNKLPSETFNISQFNIPENLFLADHQFNISSNIDILLGAQFYLSLIKTGKFVRDSNFPIIQETRLGYILAGNLPLNITRSKSTSSFLVCKDNLAPVIEKFWETEDCQHRTKSSDESICEQHFVKNTFRDEEGKFVVSLPRKSNNLTLGNSLNNALQRFQSLERTFIKRTNLKTDYSKFMNEYIELGHMTLVNGDSDDLSTNDTFYLPHHAVFKQTSSTTRVRVVFDGSAKSSNGISLNDTLLVGPNIQQDLFSIVLRFRTHNYVITSDIAKMYRQIRVNSNDCNLQRILWRDSPEKELKHYKLNTVTYGTASASFLATRCLIQIAKDNCNQFPIACKAIANDFYVDDLITGADTIQQVRQLRLDITNLLLQYGFPMHKWHSNLGDIIPSSDHTSIAFDKHNETRTLGIIWRNNPDELTYEVNHKNNLKTFSKRTILSIIAGIYDPLGLLGPVIFKCKHFMQKLWQYNLDWDHIPPEQSLLEWTELYNQLALIRHISIPRHVKVNGTITSVQIHGFADASIRGYGCCAYIRTVNDNAEIASNLLCSKSRVAPLKQISLPRLELCASLLLSRLLKKIISAMDLNINEIHLYSDSMVVLHWIHAPSSKWKVFVANRVTEIQQNTSQAKWHHIKSQDNPADILSRGCLPSKLQNYNHWWLGPKWLLQDSSFWPLDNFSIHNSNAPDECLIEERKTIKFSLISTKPVDLSENFSSITRLTRVFSYCFRFLHNIKTKLSDRNFSVLSTKELNDTLYFFLRQSQRVHFNSEFKDLQNNRHISNQSKLVSLNPFLDDKGLICVGGRLEHSHLSFHSRHQIILHPHAHITKLIIEGEHLRLLHAGVQSTHHSLRQRFWIVNGKAAVRSVIRKCVKCLRFSAKRQTQMLGQLPSSRVTPARAFSRCAVDYGGPILIRHGGQKSKTLTKSYISLFICMTTKAIHLELVSDLTSDAFIAALKRFISRRGIPSKIFSDNGTNFRAARNNLYELFNLFKNTVFKNNLQSFSSSQGIDWSFIPPSSPHFGGLWESGIKGVKFHLRRVIGKSVLNFEELYTVLTQIEACLNSRPLFAISSDSRDPEPLTPGHFLIGTPILSIPDPDFTDVPVNRLGRWQLLQRFIQSVWKKWSKDYLHQLQQRNKWRFPNRNLREGDMVLILDDNTPPLLWKTGVVIRPHPGADDLVRVVDVRTANGTYRRPIHKLCYLPVTD